VVGSRPLRLTNPPAPKLLSPDLCQGKLEAAYARIIADEGIAQKVRNAEWQAAIDALISHMRTGEIAAGFIAAIARCGAVLAAHAPPERSANELPDRLYVM
jgi:putative membrane protein